MFYTVQYILEVFFLISEGNYCIYSTERLLISQNELYILHVLLPGTTVHLGIATI